MIQIHHHILNKFFRINKILYSKHLKKEMQNLVIPIKDLLWKWSLFEIKIKLSLILIKLKHKLKVKFNTNPKNNSNKLKYLLQETFILAKNYFIWINLLFQLRIILEIKTKVLFVIWWKNVKAILIYRKIKMKI